MQIRNTPVTGPRYWAALCVASIFGANMGDFVSHELHMGHANGLAPLALIFAIILFAERRLRMPTEAWYWLAIVTMRTAATNLGDLLTHEFHIPFPAAIAGLIVALAAILLIETKVPTKTPTTGVPDTNAFYWVAMLTAGTLGTDVGDYLAGGLKLGLGLGSLILIATVVAALALRGLPGWAPRPTYWIAVVTIRSAGTTVGDYFESRHGLNLGLPICTAFWAVVLIALLLAWRTPNRPHTAAVTA